MRSSRGLRVQWWGMVVQIGLTAVAVVLGATTGAPDATFGAFWVAVAVIGVVAAFPGRPHPPSSLLLWTPAQRAWRASLRRGEPIEPAEQRSAAIQLVRGDVAMVLMYSGVLLWISIVFAGGVPVAPHAAWPVVVSVVVLAGVAVIAERARRRLRRIDRYESRFPG